MDKIKTKEGNRLIMFFDGAESSTIEIMGEVSPCIKYKDSYYPEDTLPNFHDDWNLLMPVVEQIETLTDEDGRGEVNYTVSIEEKQCIISLSGEGEIVFREGDTKIEATWITVVEFIKIYNQQKEVPNEA